MKKKILIIGNNEGLPGVKVDMQNYKTFFISQNGGEWRDDEIFEELNPTRDHILTLLDKLKQQQLDYLIVVFSGHGGQGRETVLELNGSEYLSESRLHDLAVKQLNIFDCCRAFSPALLEGVRNKIEKKAMSYFSTRERYEKRISQAIPQMARLYACKEGEVAQDTSEGGAYSKNLIYAAIGNVEYTTVGVAHQRAAEQTSAVYGNQHPDAILPRCLSGQELIIGIKP
jgi:hypothetical protein